MSNQLSAFCGRVSGFMSMAESCWQGREMFITCTPQPARSGEERRMRGSFQCLRKQMTWMLLYGTLNTQNSRSASGYQSTAHKEGFLASRLCKKHQSAAQAQKLIQRFCQLLSQLYSQTQDQPYPVTEKVTQMTLMEILKLESPSFYYTVIKESANVSVRFKFQNTTNILSKYVHKQMATLSFLLKHHQFNSNCWELHISKQINSSWES